MVFSLMVQLCLDFHVEHKSTMNEKNENLEKTNKQIVFIFLHHFPSYHYRNFTLRNKKKEENLRLNVKFGQFFF